ncbi:MAG: hypothetical protein ACI8RZ_003986 [Myxococcota bacterium]|jgi:hypothetical protein
MPLLWMLLGCATESDADRYYRLTTGGGDPARRIAECLKLSSTTMQSDCQLTVVNQAEDMSDLCESLSEPIWRSECYFMAAERLKISAPEEAERLCMKANHFQNECVQHLWQFELMSLTRHGSRSFPNALPRATALYVRWEALAEDSDMEVRFWRMFYTSGFQRAQFLSPSHCAPLPGEHQIRCRQAAAAHYTKQIRHIATIPRAMGVLCALDPVTSAAAAETRVPELSAEPAAELDAVVVAMHGQLCEGGLPREDIADVELLLPGFDEE